MNMWAIARIGNFWGKITGEDGSEIEDPSGSPAHNPVSGGGSIVEDEERIRQSISCRISLEFSLHFSPKFMVTNGPFLIPGK